MARQPKPWYWEDRGEWYVTINRVRHRLGEDKKAATAKFHELMSGKRTQVQSDAVSAVLDQFLSWTEAHRSPKTYRGYKDFCQSFHSTFPRLRISELKPFHVQQWAEGKTTWNATTQRGAITALVRGMNWAMKMGHIDRNPLAGIEKPEASKRETLISEGEFNGMLEHVNQQFRDLLVVSWETGCRPQETKAVEARHVQFDLHRWVLPPLESKGKKKPRIVYMTPRAEEVVKRLVEQYPEGKLFRNVRGRPWTASCVKMTFERLEGKLGTRYCQYNFRHSFGHRMLTERKLDSLVVAELMGHSSPMMLATTYSHLNANPEHLLKAVGASEQEKEPDVSVPPARRGKSQGKHRRQTRRSG
ncbi:MAG: tyrosine-type recombinase/integrase [Planctomycetota bacterium]|nr:tyrosine-type recombinase/integrase [Planctomycetota bacterium]